MRKSIASASALPPLQQQMRLPVKRHPPSPSPSGDGNRKKVKEGGGGGACVVGVGDVDDGDGDGDSNGHVTFVLVGCRRLSLKGTLSSAAAAAVAAAIVATTMRRWLRPLLLRRRCQLQHQQQQQQIATSLRCLVLVLKMKQRRTRSTSTTVFACRTLRQLQPCCSLSTRRLKCRCASWRWSASAPSSHAQCVVPFLAASTSADLPALVKLPASAWPCACCRHRTRTTCAQNLCTACLRPTRGRSAPRC